MSAKRTPNPKCGHVFVIHCGAAGMAADGVLINNGEQNKGTALKLVEIEHVRARYQEAGMQSNADDLMELYRSFLEESAAKFKGKSSSFSRAKPLLAFDPSSFFSPDLSAETKEAVLKDIVTLSYSIADDSEVDIALCLPDREKCLQVKNFRFECCPFEDGPFWMLTKSQKEVAASLAEKAKVGRLALFVGAGISISSGAPSWGGLLDDLATMAGMSEEDREALKSLSFLDQPQIIEDEMGDEFKPNVAKLVQQASRFTPAHALLKTLKSPAVTTNYDDLYENAARSCGDIVPILPWESRKLIKSNHPDENSLLKLHGSVDHPESIVLSRTDYMRYEDNAQALRGRLHSLFLTKEVLFLGFSMTDDNVHKVIDDVRKVVYEDGEPPETKLGTILSMTDNDMFTRLWEKDFDVYSFGKSWGDDPNWYHDCFLDLISADVFEN